MTLLQTMAKELALDEKSIHKIVVSSGYRYKMFERPKRSGGQRIIQQPSASLKMLQRWCAKRIFSRLPVHESAYAYIRNRDIRMHADQHARFRFLARVDFRDFFPSISDASVENLLQDNQPLLAGLVENAADQRTVAQIVCRRGGLVIGSPSSPIVSNCVMWRFDSRWSEQFGNIDVRYTRYSDDIYLSTNTPNVLSLAIEGIRTFISETHVPRLSINDEKTIFTSRKRLRRVTGLVLSSTNQVSIGRNSKRLLKSLVYRAIRGQLSETEVLSLRGLLSHVSNVEPRFIASMERKYRIDLSKRDWITTAT
jgi:RNA-directed DNA polymerase